MKVTKHYKDYEYAEACEDYKNNPTQEALNALGEWYHNYYVESWNGEHYRVDDKDLNFTGLCPIYSYEENPIYEWLLKKRDEADQNENYEVYKFIEEELNDIIDDSELIRYDITTF
ncbi:MAG: hypothetical protein ACTTK5_04585 [Candidatus Fimenecus sp.]